MATKRKKRARARKLPGKGAFVEFHGAFASEDRAKKRARARGGYYLKRRVGRQRRYVVVVQKESPF